MGREKSVRRGREMGQSSVHSCTRALYFWLSRESGSKRTESNAGSTGACAPSVHRMGPAEVMLFGLYMISKIRILFSKIRMEEKEFSI